MTASLRQRLADEISIAGALGIGEGDDEILLDRLMSILASDEGAARAAAAGMDPDHADDENVLEHMRAALDALARHVKEG